MGQSVPANARANKMALTPAFESRLEACHNVRGKRCTGFVNGL
jgi:hypothetical protein